jgi:hypothetical protein
MVGSRKLLRGHYNPVNKSRKHANLQWAKVDGERKRVCTACIKQMARKPAKLKN